MSMRDEPKDQSAASPGAAQSTSVEVKVDRTIAAAVSAGPGSKAEGNVTVQTIHAENVYLVSSGATELSPGAAAAKPPPRPVAAPAVESMRREPSYLVPSVPPAGFKVPRSFRTVTRPLKHAVVLDEQMLRRLCNVIQATATLTIEVRYGGTKYKSPNLDNIAIALREHHSTIELVALRAANKELSNSVILALSGRYFGYGRIVFGLSSDESKEWAYQLAVTIEDTLKCAVPWYDFMCRRHFFALFLLLGGIAVQAGMQFGVRVSWTGAAVYGWATMLVLLSLGRLWLWPKVKFSF